jgi:hypothetical protein
MGSFGNFLMQYRISGIGFRVAQCFPCSGGCDRRPARHLKSEMLKSAIHGWLGSFRDFHLTADYADIADTGALNLELGTEPARRALPFPCNSFSESPQSYKVHQR